MTAKAPKRKARSATKHSPGKTPVLVPQPHGGAILVGNPGNKGGGRTPDEFKKMCQELAVTGAKGVKLIMDEANPHEHPAFLGALKWATEHGYGKPKETKEINATIQHSIVILPAIDE